MLSQSDLATRRIARQLATDGADDIAFLLDEIEAWQGRLHDAYRGRLSDAACELHDALSNAAGQLMRERDSLEEQRIES